MQDISGFGLIVTLIASNTFPAGITLTQFADDADPVDMQSIQVADKAMGLNGDLVTWAKATPVPCILNIIPGSDDDRNMSILAENNRVGRGKLGSRDVITLTIVYPDGSTAFLNPGVLTDAMLAKSIASAGRMKSKNYTFAFENITR
jgi:hypothetical protein